MVPIYAPRAVLRGRVTIAISDRRPMKTGIPIGLYRWTPLLRKDPIVIIVAGHLTVAPEARAAYLDNCRDLMSTARSTPGCLDFHLSADALERDRINVYERWSGRDDLDAFRGSGPDDRQSEQILGADVREYFYEREVLL
jgi:quinol monooxygenase YgiN